MERGLARRLAAVRLVLAEQDGLPAHVHVSKLQAAALAAELQRSELSSQARADLGSTLLGMRWVDGDLQALLSLLADNSSPVGKRRRTMQSYVALTNHLPACTWDKLTDTDFDSSGKLHLLLSWACRLGLRTPSEPSLKWFTSLWIVLTEAEV
jgi:hypothetical protein